MHELRVAPVLWLLLVSGLGPSLAFAQDESEDDEAPHPCDENHDPTGEACADACVVETPAEICNEVCNNDAGVSWCRAHCDAQPGLECLGEYRPAQVCEVYDGVMLRLGFRGAIGAQLRDRSAAFIGAQLVLGARVTSEVSIVAKLRGAPIGLDADANWIASVGAELGVEAMFFQVFSATTAMTVGGSAGFWLPNYCMSNADCPVALPMVSVETATIFFADSPAPWLGLYSGWSIGLEGGVGYDPFLGEVLGRVSLMFGLELSAR